MKKILMTSLLGLFSFCAEAYSLQNVASSTNESSQQLGFNFDTPIANPIIMASGNDLIVDFMGADIANGKLSYQFADGYVHNMTLTQTPQKVRAIIPNGANYTYVIQQTSNGISLNFSNQPAPGVISGKQIGKINVKNDNGLALVTVDDIKFKRDDNGGGVIEITYTGNNQIRVKEQRLGDKLSVQLNEINFDPSLVRRIDASDFATPVKFIDSKSNQNNQLDLSIINRNSWDYAIYQLQGKLLIDIRDTSKASETNGSDIPLLNQGKSNRISLNFQNVDVRALLQLLADFSGYNILVSDSVTGTTSLKLNNVPWDQALQIILNSKGLGMRRDGNVIRIAPISELSALSKMQQDSQKAQEAIEPIDSLTVRLKYAQAASIQGMLTQGSSGGGSGGGGGAIPPGGDTGSSGGSPAANTTNTTNGTDTSSGGGSNNQMLSSRGSILVDTRTNTLIINDTPTRLKEIKELIDKIDVPVKQVMIEARIVEAKDTFERTLGTRLFIAGLNSGFTVSNTIENAIKVNQQGIGVINDDPSKFINSNFIANQTGAISAIYQPNSNQLIGLEVDAIELQSQGKTISSPKVITANYQPANIQQGIQIPYQQASSAGNTNVSFVNATLSLQVTPQITEDGNIMLDVNIQKNSPSALFVQGQPSIDTSSVNTQVLIQDGSTILVGGIYVDEQSTSISMIPGLGDIPFLGWLFKSQRVTNNKKELLICIRWCLMHHTCN